MTPSRRDSSNSNFHFLVAGVINLGITGGTPYDSLVLYRRNRETLKHAKVIVIDYEYHYAGVPPKVTSRLSRFGTTSDRVRLFGRSRQIVPALLGGIWRTFGMREYLRALIDGSVDATDWVLADDGRVQWRDESLSTEIDVDADIARMGAMYESKSLDGRHAGELDRLIQLAKKDQSKIILLHLPLRDRFVSYLGHEYPDNYRRYRQALTEHRFDVDRFVDWQQGEQIGATDNDFIDYGHLNESGSRIVSQKVSQLIQPFVGQ